MPELAAIQDIYEIKKIKNNPKTMEALYKSDQDIEAGRVKEVTSVKELLDEL